MVVKTRVRTNSDEVVVRMDDSEDRVLNQKEAKIVTFLFQSEFKNAHVLSNKVCSSSVLC